jgi:O-antigen/teichoic acid export membrane protein
MNEYDRMSTVESTHTSLPDGHTAASGNRAARALPNDVPTSLKANCAWTVGSNVLFAGCQWLMLMVIAKLCPPTAVGQFTVAMAVTSPVFQFSTLQLRPILATDVRRQYAFGEYLTLRIYMTAAACITVALICAVSTYSTATKWAIALAAVSKAFDSISDIFHARLQQEERMDRMAIGLIARGVISLVVLATILFATGNAAWSVGGLALGSAAVALGFDSNNGKMGFDALRRSRWFRGWSFVPESGDVRRLLQLSRTALPLGVVLLLATLIGNVPRLFIAHYLG